MTVKTSAPIRWRFVLLGVTAVLAFLLVAIQIYNRMFDRWGDDFEVFWLAARMPLETVYIPGPDRPFAYPPSALPLVKALGLLPQILSYLVFVGLSAAAFFWAGRRLYSREAVLMALACPSMVWAFAAGQLTVLLSALLFLAFSLPSVWKGALVAVVLSIKPQFAFMAPLVLWSDRKAFLSMAGTGFALLALSVAWFGISQWKDWFGALEWFRLVTRTTNVDGSVISFPGEVRNLGYPVGPALAAAIAVSAYIAIRKPIADPVALIVGCSIFASPYALPYDLVALVPWVSERLLRDKVDGWLWAKVLLFIGFIFPVAWLLALAGCKRHEVVALRLSGSGPDRENRGIG